LRGIVDFPERMALTTRYRTLMPSDFDSADSHRRHYDCNWVLYVSSHWVGRPRCRIACSPSSKPYPQVFGSGTVVISALSPNALSGWVHPPIVHQHTPGADRPVVLTPVQSPICVPRGDIFGSFWLTVALMLANKLCASVSLGSMLAVFQMLGYVEAIGTQGAYE
jgi:hypothetical protein